MKMLKNTILFDISAREEILDAFDKKIDEKGYIVEKSKPEQKVLTTDGDEIEAKKFAGIRKGSEIFIRSDLNSLIELSDKLE